MPYTLLNFKIKADISSKEGAFAIKNEIKLIRGGGSGGRGLQVDKLLFMRETAVSGPGKVALFSSLLIDASLRLVCKRENRMEKKKEK